MDFVPREIEEHVEKYMKRWENYLTQDQKDKHSEYFYLKRLDTEEDPETKKFFESKLAELKDSRHVQGQNVSSMNSKVRQIVAEMCKAHNDSLVE